MKRVFSILALIFFILGIAVCFMPIVYIGGRHVSEISFFEDVGEPAFEAFRIFCAIFFIPVVVVLFLSIFLKTNVLKIVSLGLIAVVFVTYHTASAFLVYEYYYSPFKLSLGFYIITFLFLAALGLSIANVIVSSIIYKREQRAAALQKQSAASQTYPGAPVQQMNYGYQTPQFNMGYQMPTPPPSNHPQQFNMGYQTQTPPPSNNIGVPEQLMEYKKLLDLGVITPEEKDAKKKQLLGL